MDSDEFDGAKFRRENDQVSVQKSIKGLLLMADGLSLFTTWFLTIQECVFACGFVLFMCGHILTWIGSGMDNYNIFYLGNVLFVGGPLAMSIR
jgi:hypothetical protein